MIEMKTKIKQAAEYILSKITEKPTVAVVLGSGLGDFADTLENAVAINSTEKTADATATESNNGTVNANTSANVNETKKITGEYEKIQ